MRRGRMGMVVGVVLAFAAVPASASAGLLTSLVSQTTASVSSLLPLVPKVAADVHATGRGRDQLANPDYLLRALPDVTAALAGKDPDDNVDLDPYRKNWSGTRGVIQAISYTNRYGAKIVGHLLRPSLPFRDPVTGVVTNGPLPAIIMVNGYGSVDHDYFGLDQSLAEDGYVVMTFDAQGEGFSDTYPNPTSTFCDPNGAWRAPQEMGLHEQGPCAGVEPSRPTPGILGPLADDVANVKDVGAVASDIAYYEAELLQRDTYDAALKAFYDATITNFAFGALDAVSWLRSTANPWLSLIDTSRVGVMGHSLGAFGALLAGNGDPQHRFSAVATYDGYGTPGPSFTPTQPTMLQMADNADWPVPLVRNQDDHPSAHIGARIRAAGVDEMQIALRGSTHDEWYYTALQLMSPLYGPLDDASSKGERVSVYYTQAWFDRYLKGRDLNHSVAEAAQRADADRRLLARTFDGSVDGSSIGQGTYDLATLRNRPYTIAGESVPDHLSQLLRSAYSFAGHTCLDMLHGC